MNKEVLKQIIIENQGFVASIELVKRNLQIEPLGNYIFTGSRRAGKTYCLFQIIQGLLEEGIDKSRILYINFEDERLMEMTVNDLASIIDAYSELYPDKPIFFLDEIQNIEGWEKFCRRLADMKYRVFITGSNAKMLSREMATVLGGRFLIKEIYPFSFTEYLKANQIELNPNWMYGTVRFEVRRLFDTYFVYGGFPELLNFREKRMWLDNVYQKIFYSDLIARYKIRNEFALKLLIKKLAENIHDEVSFSRIKNIIQSSGTKIGTNTVIEYCEALGETYLTFGLSNYLAKIADRESLKKYYFIDNGILSLFLFNPDTILLENIVAVHLKEQFGQDFYYLRGDTEVDFYIPSEKRLIQVAYNLNSAETEKRECNALVKAIAKLQEREPGEEKRNYEAIIITLDMEKEIEYENRTIRVVPVWKWLLSE
ncbi:MAG: ATP-binding protein [Bacteroidales bacterium]